MWIVWLEKKILQTLGIIVGLLVVLLTAFHFWLVNNAEKLIEDLVASESNNTVKLKVKNLKFNYFSRKIELENAVFYSNDSLDLNTSYRFHVSNIRLKVRALLPVFLQKQLLIDSLYLSNPDIEVTRLKRRDQSEKKEVSIPEEMGKIYNSIMEALVLLHVNRFEFNNGKFTLLNKIHENQQPLVLSNLNFYIDNLLVDSSQHAKYLQADQMVFRTRDQDILFPDGNHRLAFSQFRINIQEELIEIDSCTISGKRSDSSRAGFSVFLDTLKLIRVDFNALYTKELIKADTVYCGNPDFKIVLESKAGKKGELPNLDTIVQQLTGDLLLRYINVVNADIDITTYRDDTPSSFTSENNNFEMEELSIDHNLPKPVSLKSFTMAIRNYENFIRDSSYFLRFDSILLRSDNIFLSNFSINTLPGIDAKNIRVPRFELAGLSWSALLFDRNIKARQATLYGPEINYTRPKNFYQKKRKSFFDALGGINKLMELDRLKINHGNIKLQLGEEAELNLQNASILVNSEQLTGSKEFKSVEQSVQELDFDKGILKLKNIFAELKTAAYKGNNNALNVEQARIYNHKQTLNVVAKKLFLDQLQFDDLSNYVSANIVNWEQANIEINALPEENKKLQTEIFFDLKNLDGRNTNLVYNDERKNISATVNQLIASSISRQEKLKITGLKTAGKYFSMSDNIMNLNIDSFSFHDNNPSVLYALRFQQFKNNDSLSINIPETGFTSRLDDLMNNAFHAGRMKWTKPEISVKSTGNKEIPAAGKSLPDINITKFELEEPVFLSEKKSADAPFLLKWNGTGNRIIIDQFQTMPGKDGISANRLAGIMSNINITNKKGKVLTSRDIQFDIESENIEYQTTFPISWSGMIRNLKTSPVRIDSLGKQHGKLSVPGLEMKNLFVNNELVKNIPGLLDRNPDFTLHIPSGQLVNDKTDLRWYGLDYTQKNHIATLDSFFFKPILSREAFIAADSFQTDYITMGSGPVSISDIDAGRYFTDSTFKAGNIHLENPFFTSYRDMRPPFRAGIIKPLPTGLIKKIPFKISVDTVYVDNGKVVYTELNKKNEQEGILTVTRMTGDIFPIRNVDLHEKDSFRIRLNGYLLDAAWIRLRTRESYLDSLSGFIMTVRMRPGSLLYLNEILVPLTGVKLKSGHLDTLNMRVVAKDDLSLGEMKMFYHNLKVEFLEDRAETKKRFVTGLKTFIANSFVIKNKNKRKTGIVYFPRLRDRSFVNYYIKIVFSGIASSIGAKNNKKLLRRYNRQLKKKSLPPPDID